MSKKTWKELNKTYRQSSNVEDRRGFNNTGQGAVERLMFDKSPTHTWGKDPENEREATMKRIEERVRQHNEQMRKYGE